MPIHATSNGSPHPRSQSRAATLTGFQHPTACWMDPLPHRRWPAGIALRDILLYGICGGVLIVILPHRRRPHHRHLLAAVQPENSKTCNFRLPATHSEPTCFMLYAEPSNTNWLGNQVELPSFTAAKLQSQVAVGHSKTMLFKIALSVLAVIVALLLIAAIKPNSFRVQRSITIHASKEEVFSLINDLHSWDAWSDDGGGGGTVQKTYTGPASGVGAVAEWNGSGRAGAAKMLITESVVPSKVSVQVDWIKPFRAHNLKEFTIHAQGDDTQATWSIQASNL
jgi:Polyketide cyclase / dehydrase and lipid transport